MLEEDIMTTGCSDVSSLLIRKEHDILVQKPGRKMISSDSRRLSHLDHGWHLPFPLHLDKIALHMLVDSLDNFFDTVMYEPLGGNLPPLPFRG